MHKNQLLPNALFVARTQQLEGEAATWQLADLHPRHLRGYSVSLPFPQHHTTTFTFSSQFNSTNKLTLPHHSNQRPNPKMSSWCNGLFSPTDKERRLDENAAIHHRMNYQVIQEQRQNCRLYSQALLDSVERNQRRNNGYYMTAPQIAPPSSPPCRHVSLRGWVQRVRKGK